MPKRSSKRRRKSNRALEGFFLMGVGLVLGALAVQLAQAIWESTAGKVSVIGSASVFVVILVVRFLRAAWKRAELRDAIAQVKVSDEYRDYVITNDDYRRGNPKESLYRKTFVLPLLDLFGNRCAKCGSNDNGVDIDHFFMSKNEGGNFIMRHKNGHLVNNAIPLCQHCNRSKSDKSYQAYFTKQETLRLFQKNQIMTEKLNALPLLTADGGVVKRKRMVA